MRWLDKLERKYGKYAIKGLMTYIVGISGFVFLLSTLDTTGTYIQKLMLIPDLVMRGQIWRLITYIFIPPAASMIFIIFALYFYYMIGSALEHEWGSFRFNLYYFIGMIGTTAAAFITGGAATSTYLNLSLFLAFAKLYPDYEILLFFFVPVKMKYMAWFNWAFIGYTVLFVPSISLKVAAVVSLLNYFVFFGKDALKRSKRTRMAYNNRKRFQENIPVKTHFHRCEICGITEIENPNMEFRYCSTCKGLHEYCMDHLRNHEHKTE
jgi:membrane associated rhomboid family serine protease